METITLTTKPVVINKKYMVTRNGRMILSKEYREGKEAMAWEIASQWHTEPQRDDVTLNILFYFGDKRKRDIDAYLKILLDAMSEIVYEDDSQVTEMHVFKDYDKDNPRTEIQVL